MKLTGSEKPATLAPQFEAIPDAMTAYPSWVVWRWERKWDRQRKEHTWTKPPFKANGDGGHASTTDPTTWSPFEDAVGAYERDGVDGVGIRLTEDLSGIDLDDVVDPDTGTIHPEAQRIAHQINSYTEKSPSGRGLRIFTRGALPKGWRSTKKWRVPAIEMYDRDSPRYLTVTGHHLPETPPTVEERTAELAVLHAEVAAAIDPAATKTASGVAAEPVGDGWHADDDALLAHACGARNGEGFRRLFYCGISDGEDHSVADLSLCLRLAFCAGRDAARIDRLFRRSALMRGKWDERHSATGETYGEMTIAKAVTSCGDTYSPNGQARGEDGDHDTEGSALRVHRWDELTAGEMAPITWHWPGWVGLASVAVLAGAGESLKSWLCLYLACMTAAGRPALADPGSDEPPLRAGPVIYLSGENSIEEDRRRAQLLKAGLDLPDDLPLYFVAAESLSLGNRQDYEAVIRLVEETRPVALFVDSAIALSGVAQENDNTQVRTFLKARILPLARRRGVTAYLIAHSPKPPMQLGGRFTDEHVARGASDWRNAADAVLYLRRDPTFGELAVVLRHAKNRIGPRHAPIWFQLEDVEPDKAVRLAYGGTFTEDTGQSTPGGLKRAIDTAIEILKQTPSGIYLREVEQRMLGASIAKATYRRALDTVRGKKPWPYGAHRGKRQAIATEDRHGREVFLTFDAAQWPEHEEWPDA